MAPRCWQLHSPPRCWQQVDCRSKGRRSLRPSRKSRKWLHHHDDRISAGRIRARARHRRKHMEMVGFDRGRGHCGPGSQQGGGGDRSREGYRSGSRREQGSSCSARNAVIRPRHLAPPAKSPSWRRGECFKRPPRFERQAARFQASCISLPPNQQSFRAFSASVTRTQFLRLCSLAGDSVGNMPS